MPVPVSRNTDAQIRARKEYSLKAMGWARESLVFIDETTFSKGLHSTRGTQQARHTGHIPGT